MENIFSAIHITHFKNELLSEFCTFLAIFIYLFIYFDNKFIFVNQDKKKNNFLYFHYNPIFPFKSECFTIFVASSLLIRHK